MLTCGVDMSFRQNILDIEARYVAALADIREKLALIDSAVEALKIHEDRLPEPEQPRARRAAAKKPQKP